MNILLFLLTGFIIGRWRGAIIGFTLSCFIELAQYAFILGHCEADDVMHNTIGAILGVIIWKVGGSRMYQKVFKRIIDFCIALVAMPFLAIIFIFVAPAIVVNDGFPIFYNAKRIGQNGKLFKMYKFRSMKNNAPDIRLADGSTYNGADDPRVTKVGKFLRSTSIDELPQLLNMLKGDMSLIGPRPDPPDWLDKYPEDIRVFLKVKPGITGYSQAYFRNSVDGEEKMKNDAFYATHCTFWMDVKIFFKTIMTVLGHENTYKDFENESNQLDEAAKQEIEKLKK